MNRPPRALRRPAALAVVAVALALAVPVSPAAASPSPSPTTGGQLASMTAQASALRTQVADLQVQTETATEQYDALTDQLATVVSQQLSAAQSADQLGQVAAASRHTGSARVRALYMSGGSAGLYISVLDGGTIGDVLTRVRAVQSLVRSDTTTTATDDGAVATAQGQATRLAALASRRAVLSAQADRARTRVQAALTRSTSLLATADAGVKALAEQQRVEAERQAAAQARQQLASLGLLTDIAGPPNSQAGAAVSAAATKLGLPYVYAATGPDAYDCSGLTQWAYRQAGVTLPRTAAQQWYAGPHVALDQLLPGDLLFWAVDTRNPATIHHVAIYAGGGTMIEAPHTGAFVRKVAMYLNGLVGAVRPTAATTGPA